MGRDIKSVYSNGVPAAAVEQLRAYATRQLGFRRTAVKSTATLHLVKRRGFTSAAVSYSRRPGWVGRALLRSSALAPGSAAQQ